VLAEANQVGQIGSATAQELNKDRTVDRGGLAEEAAQPDSIRQR
jgi:hypothetical protein